MKRIKITINTENDAFYPEWEHEVAKILRETVKEIERGSFPEMLRDINGNRVGTVEYE